MKIHPTLPLGYSAVGPGRLANIVTCLEMTQRASMDIPHVAGMSFHRWTTPALDDYRQLFRAVGENWLWVSRLEMSDDALAAHISNPETEVFFVEADGRKIGFLELNFSRSGECEIVYCGLVTDAIGKGAGRFLMGNALKAAWSGEVGRVWLHTCNFDHPSAYPFYCRSGFHPYQFLVEVIDDPRLSGILPRTAAPHVPFLYPGAINNA